MAQIEATVTNLQTQLTAVQAALDGNSNSGLFKQPTFSGLPNEDVNEWVIKFDRLSKFYNWSNAKKLGALPLLLSGPALAWYQTLPAETSNDFSALIEQLKNRFGAQNLEFIFRQELYSRKQGPNEPLSMYTEDIIRRCQRLSLSDNDMMNVFINGLADNIKNHVILNQPKSFAEADNLARLRNAVNISGGTTSHLGNAQGVAQAQRIKELEGQVNLLMSLASQKEGAKLNSPPSIQALETEILAQSRPNPSTNPFLPLPTSEPASQATSNFGMQEFKNDIIAAIDARLSNNQFQKKSGNPQRFPSGYARGRSLRTTDGQPICNTCQRVGHVARYCNSRPQFSVPQYQPRYPRQPFQSQYQQTAAYEPPFQQPRFQAQISNPRPRFQNQPRFQSTDNQQFLNETGSSQWGN